jgi:hypothetical protein
LEESMKEAFRQRDERLKKWLNTFLYFYY